MNQPQRYTVLDAIRDEAGELALIGGELLLALALGGAAYYVLCLLGAQIPNIRR